MIRRFFIIGLFLAGNAFSQEPPAWFTESLLEMREDVAAAAADGKRVMLYFGQDGCPYCKRLMEVNFRQATLARKAERNFVALALNIWGDREVTWVDGRNLSEKRLAAELKVQFTPTLLFLDERGGVALRINGYLPPHELETAFDYVIAKQEKKVAFADYLRAKAPPAASADLHPQPFFVQKAGGRKPLAVLFETPQCAQCDELHAVVFKRREVLEQLARFDVMRYSIFDQSMVVTPEGKRVSAAAWARALGVGYVPTLVLFDRGREVFRTEAYLRPFHVTGALEYVASRAYASEPSFQRFLQAKAERQRERGERVELWK